MLLFDRTRSLSLHLFEHVHGESRDRGQAMVDLQGALRAARPRHDADRAARLPAAVPRIPVRRAARSRGARAARPAGARPRGARRAACASASRPTRRCSRALVALADGKPQAERRAGAARPSPTRIPTTSRPSTPPGRRRRSPSAPALPTPAARTAWPPSCARRAGRRRDAAPTPSVPSSPAAIEPRLRRSPCATSSITSLFGWYPYLCLTVFLLGSLLRFDREQYTWRTRLQPAPAPPAADVGLEPVPCRHPGHLLRPFRSAC